MIKIEENKKAKVYNIKNNGEYGTFVLMYQEKYLEIICHTSFGTYGHHWNAPGKDAFNFLINLSYESFIYKMTEGNQYVLDDVEQEKLMNELIDKLILEKNWNENDVKYYKELVESVVYCGKTTEKEFKERVVYSELFTELYDDDIENIITKEKVDEQLKGLWNELWIPLIEKIKTEK